MVMTNFTVRRLTPAEVLVAKREWDGNGFIATGEYWLAEFQIDGLKRRAGIMRGRRPDVAHDIDQFDIQLRINQEELDEDTPAIPEAQVAEILRIVDAEWQKGQYWER